VSEFQGRDVVLLMGPTASGKTDLAMRIADRVDVRIISVD
jgi:tRNA A37 N6-isopentenylltransferase MiaA